MIKIAFLLAFHIMSCTFSTSDKSENAAKVSIAHDSIDNILPIDNHSIPSGDEYSVTKDNLDDQKAIKNQASENLIPSKKNRDTYNDPASIDNKAQSENRVIDEQNSVKNNNPDKQDKEISTDKKINDQSIPPNSNGITPPDHQILDNLLKKHVNDGVVDYAGLKRDADLLNKYIINLENNPPKNNDGRNEKLAYWINAYNAYTLKLIVDNYPLKSITDLHQGKPWDVKWIKIDGKNLSLNDIEHTIIRPTFKEPRIHFAVNCAAKSCPPLASTAFTADNLNSLLEERTKQFINNPQYNTLNKSKIQVSKIFDWYKEDFGDLISFINKYSEKEIAANARVSFSEYDWALNN